MHDSKSKILKKNTENKQKCAINFTEQQANFRRYSLAHIIEILEIEAITLGSIVFHLIEFSRNFIGINASDAKYFII